MNSNLAQRIDAQDFTDGMDLFKKSRKYQFKVKVEQSHTNLFNFIKDSTPEFATR